MKHFLLILLSVFLLGNARAQISNGQINYELRVDQFRQSCDNDALSADDNEVRIGLTSDGNTGGTSTWTSGGNGAACGGNLYVRRWQADAPSTVTNTNTLLYLATNRNNVQDFFTINHASWEEDGAPDCDPSGDACQSSGTVSYTFKSGTKTPSLWWGNNGTLNGAFVTGQSGDFFAKSVWRYTNGESCTNPLIFGTLSNGVTYTHTNSNRLAPVGATTSMGYTNTAGNSAQDVYYQFTISTASTVTISTVNGVTNFDTFLRLYSSSCGTQLAFNDDFTGAMAQIDLVALCPRTYIVMVEGFSTNSGDFQLSVLANSITASGGSISGITNGVSVCSGSDPGAFTGTAATGTGLLTYQWELSTTSAASGYSSVSGETGLNYDPGTISQTTWFRRRVTDECGNVSYSNVVQVIIATPSSPPTSISGTTALCAGGSTTLTLSGGTAGTGAVAQWYSGACGGTLVGTGNSILVSPAATTTYYVRYAGTCNTTTCASATVTVNTLSTAPTSIIGTTALCAGGSTTLTLSGGTAGTGATAQWYSGSCGGTLVGTGNSISVSPAITTTYFVRYAGTCNTTTCASATVTVNTLSTAPTSIIGTTALCAGGSTTLTLSGGTAGTGATAQWYSGSCGGTLVGTGNSISVSPAITTTYFVRYAGTCNTTTCASATVTVNTLSTAPTSIIGTTTLCAGGSTTLTLSGGTAGTGATAQWYSGSCGGTLVGTGNSISVSPAATTTYFVRYSGACNTTACASVTVTVNSASSAVTTISGPSSSVCPNTTTTLIASGGTSGSGSQIYWYSGPNGTGSLLGTGANLLVSPNAATTYYVRREGTCNTSADLSYTLNVKSYIYAADGTASNTYCTDNSGWNHFYTGDNIIYSCSGDFSGAPAGYPIVTINNNAGFYQMSEGPNTAPDCSSNLTPGEERFEMSRSWNLDFGGGTFNPPYSVRFYYQPAEKTAIELAANNWMSTYPDCGYSYKYPTPNGFYWFKNTGMNYIPASYDGLHLSGIVSTTTNGINYTEMNGITSFSGGSGGIILTPITTLPVELLSFHSACDNATNNINIYWTTLSEHNSSHFILERSINGQDWTTVGTADAAGTSTETNNYQLTDLNVGRNQLIYYKLKQVDLDGSVSSYDLIAQKCGDQLTDFELFPNPADSWVNISIQTVFESHEDVSIQFYDVHGRLVKTTRYSTESGKVMGIDISSLNPGVYFVKWSSGNTESEPIRFVKD